MTAALLAGGGVAGLTAATAGTLNAQAHTRVRYGQPMPSATGAVPSATTALPTPAPSGSVPTGTQRFAGSAARVKLTVSPTPPPPTWVNPLPQASITSCYGQRWGRLHAGVDLAAPSGTPIHAVGAGTVVSAGDNYGGYGISVLIDHHNGFLTHYAHMSATDMKPGDVVQANQVIGLEGSTGHSTGPHLHFEVHEGTFKNTIEPTAWMYAHGVDIPGCAAGVPPL